MIADYTALITQLAQDGAGHVTVDDLSAALALAVLRYSQDRPQRVVEDVTLVTAARQVDLPTGWEAGFSQLVQVEYPLDQSPPALLPRGEAWSLYETPDGPVLLGASEWPAGAVARLTWTARHVLDEDGSTLPEQHREAVCCWAAALLCEQLASRYAANSDPTIQADRVDQTAPQKAYTQRAQALRQRYLDELGVDAKRTQAAGVVVAPSRRDSRGRPRITHPLRGAP